MACCEGKLCKITIMCNIQTITIVNRYKLIIVLIVIITKVIIVFVTVCLTIL